MSCPTVAVYKMYRKVHFPSQLDVRPIFITLVSQSTTDSYIPDLYPSPSRSAVGQTQNSTSHLATPPL